MQDLCCRSHKHKTSLAHEMDKRQQKTHVNNIGKTARQAI